MKNALKKQMAITNTLSSVAVTGFVYDKHWGVDYRCKKVDKTIEALRHSSLITNEDLDECDRNDLNTMGFLSWSDEPNINGDLLMLIPMTLYPFLPKDLKVLSFMEYDRNDCDNYEYVTLGKVDTDIRGGVLSSGILVKTV